MKFDRKRVGQTVMSLGGNGVGQVLVAVAAALLVRLFSGPEPALLPDYDIELEDGEKEDGDIELCEEPPASGKVMPVTIRWCNISCSLSEKSSESVSLLLFSSFFKVDCCSHEAFLSYRKCSRMFDRE